jgi:hypothetical protein
MNEDGLTSTLRSLGIGSDSGQNPSMLRLLKAILESQRDYERPLSSIEVYGLLHREEPGSKLSKAGVRKTLRSLLEIGLVGARQGDSQKIGYFANAFTTENGLKSLAARVKAKATQEITSLDSETSVISSFDCAALALDLVEDLTGSRHRISSRLITGNESIRRAVAYNMRDIAHGEDTIRVAIESSSPFLGEDGDLIAEIADAVFKGAQVRCLVHARLENTLALTAPLKRISESGGEEKPTAEMRIYEGPNTYHTAIFNDRYMVLVVSEEPVTATWITREFNPDIIDTSISVFDASWQKARSLGRPGSKGA